MTVLPLPLSTALVINASSMLSMSCQLFLISIILFEVFWVLHMYDEFYIVCVDLYSNVLVGPVILALVTCSKPLIEYLGVEVTHYQRHSASVLHKSNLSVLCCAILTFDILMISYFSI